MVIFDVKRLTILAVGFSFSGWIKLRQNDATKAKALGTRLIAFSLHGNNSITYLSIMSGRKLSTLSPTGVLKICAFMYSPIRTFSPAHFRLVKRQAQSENTEQRFMIKTNPPLTAHILHRNRTSNVLSVVLFFFFLEVSHRHIYIKPIASRIFL